MIGSAEVGNVNVKSTSITSAVNMMISQSVYVIAGTIMMIFIARVFKTRYVCHESSLTIYAIGLVSMIVCAFWTVKGTHAWIKLGPISIQPAEFMKIAMILCLSFFLTEHEATFIKDEIKNKNEPEKIKRKLYREKLEKCIILPLILVVTVIGVGVLVQKDFGSTVILALICFMCFISTPRKYYKKYKRIAWMIIIVAWAIIIVAFVIIFYLENLENIDLGGYKFARISSWLNPMEDPLGSSYQLVNSLIAFSNGGLFGLGYGNSKQKFGYVPEAHNDFIGAITYEELGIIGLALIVVPTCIIIFKLLKYSNEVKENKSKVILIGIASYFFFHLLVNLGGVSGFIPMTGVPILLVSDGGSSTVSAFIAIGIAQSIISKHNKQKYSTDKKDVPDYV